jgi:integrase
VIGLPAALVALLRSHHAAQLRLKAGARQLWHEGDWVFTSEIGEPLNPNSDYHRGNALLRRAGVPDGRLHDARHAAATVLLILGVPERTVMGIMGWSSTAMAALYQHGTDTIRHEVAARVDGLIWSGAADDTAVAETPETKTETAGQSWDEALP